MYDQTPTAQSSAADEAVRGLNHATLSPRDGWLHPGDAYSVVGNLAHMAMMLPQALHQIGALIEQLDTAGNLRSDKNTLASDLEDTYGGLADAHDAANKLYEALNRAHSGLSPIAYQD